MNHEEQRIAYEQALQQQQAYPQYQYQYQQQQPQQQHQYENEAYRQVPQQLPQPDGMLPIEQSYIENILRLNRGKEATVYMTFQNNNQWNAKIFKGIIEAAGRDHIILSDKQSGKRYLLLMIYLDYITFDEEINYTYPFSNQQGQLSTQQPR